MEKALSGFILGTLVNGHHILCISLELLGGNCSLLTETHLCGLIEIMNDYFDPFQNTFKLSFLLFILFLLTSLVTSDA